jgi:hypothetical protein
MCVRSLARQERFDGDTCASGLVVVLDGTNTIVSRGQPRATAKGDRHASQPFVSDPAYTPHGQNSRSPLRVAAILLFSRAPPSIRLNSGR